MNWSLICAEQGLTFGELIRLANRHPRVNILQPGPARWRAPHCGRSVVYCGAKSAAGETDLRTAREVNDGNRTGGRSGKAAVADCPRPPINAPAKRKSPVLGWPLSRISTICAKARRWGSRSIARWHSGENPDRRTEDPSAAEN